MIVVKTKNFNVDTDPALRCQCGKCDGVVTVQQWALGQLQKIRDEHGVMQLTSASRCPLHPLEAQKSTPGQHAKGTAFDVKALSGVAKGSLVSLAIKHGAKGVGVAQTYVHIDFRDGPLVVWNY